MIILIVLAVLFVAYFWLDCYKKAGIKERQFVLARKLKGAVGNGRFCHKN